MDKVNQELFTKIINFEIGDHNDKLTFVDRLCRENNWSSEFALRCVDEYKKFIYLAVISDKAVTPSDEIDQVWHLHLSYTHSYWNELCADVLKMPLHHGPTKGGNTEANKYRSQYQYTLDLYALAFSTEPENDIWPNCDQRFHQADKFVRVNIANSILIKKPSTRLVKKIFGVVTMPLLLTACASSDNKSTIAIVFLIFCLVFAAYKLRKIAITNKDAARRGATIGTEVGVEGNLKDHNSEGAATISDSSGDSGSSGCGGCGG